MRKIAIRKAIFDSSKRKLIFMKILYIHQYFHTPEDPGSTRSYEMARRLVEWGHEIHMITTDRKGQVTKRGWKTTKETGINVHWYPVAYSNKMSFGNRIKAFMKFAWVSALKASILDADVVFATSTPLTIALPGIYASKRLDVPFVFEVRDLWPELPVAVGAIKNKILIKLASTLENFAYRQSAQIIALSPGMKDGIAKTGYPEQKVHVIPNSSDMELFDIPEQEGFEFREKYNWLKNRPLIVYTGALGFINGVSYFARIASEVKALNPDIRFLVVGGGKEYDSVKKKAASLEVLNKNFFMFERIPKKDMPAVLSAADIATSLVLNIEAIWANSANKFFDALASGTPVAINYGGWQAEILNKEKAGFQIHATDFKKAAKTLTEKISDKPWLDQTGNNAKKVAVNRFNRDKLAKYFEEVLKKAVDNV
jgi:glycosyltransferase involved in cell wall biosynthesis